MSRSRKNSRGNQSSVAAQQSSPLTKEQKLKIKAIKSDRQKLLAELNSPFSTTASFVINFAFLKILNMLVTFGLDVPYELESLFNRIDKHEKNVLNAYRVPMDQLMHYFQYLHENRYDLATAKVHKDSQKNLKDLFEYYSVCNGQQPSDEALSHLDTLEITEAYSKVIDKRTECMDSRDVLTAKKNTAIRFAALLTSIFGMALKYYIIDPNSIKLCKHFIKDELDAKIVNTKEEADTLIRGIELSNKELALLASRNRMIVMMITLLATPFVTYELFVAENLPYEIAILLALDCYTTILVNAGNAANKMWRNHNLESNFAQRKKFLEDIMPNGYVPERIESKGQTLESSFITLRIKNYEQVNANIVAQIIKNELLKQGIRIEGFKDNAITIRADFPISSMIGRIKNFITRADTQMPSTSDEIKNIITEKLEKYNKSILFSKQIVRLAAELAYEENGAKKDVDETIVPEMENGNPYYSCYLKVPKIYRSTVLNMDSLKGLFPEATIEFFEEDEIFKIYGATSGNEDQIIEMTKNLKRITQEFEKRLTDLNFFQMQMKSLSKQLTEIPLSAELIYDEKGFAFCKCFLIVPKYFKKEIDAESLKKLFPDAVIEKTDSGYQIISAGSGINEDIILKRDQLEKIKQVQQQVNQPLETANLPQADDTFQSKGNKNNNNNNNNVDHYKRNDNKKIPIIDFGNGITYNPNIPDGCQFLQTASDPFRMDTELFNKSAYVLFNNALYYFDKLDNTCVSITINEENLLKLLNDLGIKEKESLEQNIFVHKELSRKQLQIIKIIANHEHHKSDVVPFNEFSNSLPKFTFFCMRLSKSQLNINHFVNAGFDQTAAEEAYDAFDEMTDFPNKANGRQGATGMLFEHNEVKVKLASGQKVTVNADAKCKRLGHYGDERLYLTQVPSQGPDNRRKLYVPIAIKRHTHS